MTDDWRLHQLAPAPDDARDPAVLRPTPVHELPADDATLPLLPGMTGARSNAPQAERSSGALVASPLAERALAMQTFTVWLEPASTNGFAGWENGWSLLWSPDMNTWSLAAIVTTTNPITVHLTSDNFFFRAQRK